MNPKKAYKFCPVCGRKMEPQVDELIICSMCSFHYWINPTPSNAVIVENDQNEILLVKRAHPPKKGFWDLPGGFISAYENLEVSVMREIEEELGVVVRMGDIIGVYEDLYVYQKILNPTLTIAVSAKITDGTLTPSDDVSDFQYFSRKDILHQEVAFATVTRALTDYLKRK
jgi:NADH pyrophosphatase NudC (nudix superfamily)